ncbi:5-oxoprolinase subunit PxpB [Virgibacillus necropolis]|nr:5-oxoprolinase subunit PxpB [Virgibacillus necropolis]
MEFDLEINKETNAILTNLSNLIESDSEKHFNETIIGYRSILIEYNPLELSFKEAITKLEGLKGEAENGENHTSRHIEIPVLYGGEHGPDIESVSSYNNLSIEEVIDIHSSANYLVYFIGFTPGYPFLGGMSPEIATPRLESPRISIPPGSVGIANNQTGIYPVESPGGWRLIGQTPIQLYDAKSDQPFLFKSGDNVRFNNIDINEFNGIKEQVMKGTYKPTINEIKIK